MAKGENIFKRKDGRWEARYIKGYELSGKIKYGFCYGKTYKEAKEKVTKCKAAMLEGQQIPQSMPRHQFAFCCDEWLRSSKSRIKDSTWVKYGRHKFYHEPPNIAGVLFVPGKRSLQVRMIWQVCFRILLYSGMLRAMETDRRKM